MNDYNITKDNVVLFDIEANGFLDVADKIHCIALKQPNKEVELYTDIDKAVQILNKYEFVIAHNIFRYDAPLLNKLNYKLKSKLVDTLLLCKLAYPNIAEFDMLNCKIPKKLTGSHSLKAYGYRLGVLKGEFGDTDDWSTYSEEMGEYCKQDVVVLSKLYKKLLKKDIPTEAIRLEHEFLKIIVRQENYGVEFDSNKARRIHMRVIKLQDLILKKLKQVFKPLPTFIPVSYPKKPIKKDGSKATVLLRQEARGCFFKDKVWGYYEKTIFNPASRPHVARWLQEVHNWKPTEFTDKGNIIINEKILSKLDFKEGKLLAKYFTINKFLGYIANGDNSWLNLVQKDGRIYGKVDTLGAVTRRCVHSKPNLAQIPSTHSFMGKQSRSFFKAGKDKVFVGCDASGLELRVLAHFMSNYAGGKEYTDVILNGDIHTHNQHAAGLPTRNSAKTFIYGLLYGAGDAKIGEIIKKGANEGKAIKDKFFTAVPSMMTLRQDVIKSSEEKGFIKALDKNKYHIRSSHSSLNVLLQGAGALVMKYWLIEYDKQVNKKYRNSIDKGTTQYEFVLNIHDEAQMECDKDIAEDIAEIAKKAFLTVTKQLKWRLLLEGDAKIGNNWRDTH